MASFSAHKLNNVLTVLLDCVERLAEEPRLQDPEILEDLEASTEDVRRLSRLMLDASGRPQAKMALGDLRASVIAALPDEHPPAVHFEGDTQVRGHLRRLADLVVELAIMQTRSGAQPTRVTLSRERERTFLRVVGTALEPSAPRTVWLDVLAGAAAAAHGGTADWSSDYTTLTLSWSAEHPTTGD